MVYGAIARMVWAENCIRHTAAERREFAEMRRRSAYKVRVMRGRRIRWVPYKATASTMERALLRYRAAAARGAKARRKTHSKTEG